MEVCNYKGKNICAYDVTNNNYALNYELEKLWKIAGGNGELKCPECGLDVVLKVKDPRKKIPHFAHKTSMIKCNYYNEDLKESEDHKRGKMILYNYFKEFYPEANLRINHRFNNRRRTDIFIEFKNGGNLAIEYQRLGLDIIQWQERQKEYEKLGIKVLWILQGDEESLKKKSKQIELSFFKQIMLNERDKLAVFLDIKKVKLILMKNMEYIHKGNMNDKYDDIFSYSYSLDEVKINENGSISCDFFERYGLEENKFISKHKKECEEKELRELQRKNREKFQELKKKNEERRRKESEVKRNKEIQKELSDYLKRSNREVIRYCDGKIPYSVKVKEALKDNKYSINYLIRYMSMYASSDDYSNITTIFKYAYLEGNVSAFRIYDEIMSSAGFKSETFFEDREKNIKCPYCKGKLVKKWGQFGEFISCSNYPNCKFSFSI
ncbi:competence protein CoiA family protein [Clostridium perfringens]|uniref:competence protein CoiA family protein n=1 Tax=Clostridium perfringens TaxID=1502 RepID=UPI0013E3F36C|nr:topoisomerase DNA-binding C4 zinc finger domain-containing protein [Clostridium perfringens]EJT6143605.1 topoisomerase DNA-binding C4 zinc finger domain-containing protein [Clostridium perfringens]MDM0988659.1 competence protein CoiA family protein [Clostridium perfringens]MDM1004218.1 competence protein CoiA family protein [Clostridium perfringens]NGU53624.1 hypothetical protein [Clostridium perfringens]